MFLDVPFRRVTQIETVNRVKLFLQIRHDRNPYP